MIRRCSVCRQPGHGLDTCTDLDALRRARTTEASRQEHGYASAPARLRSIDHRIRMVRGATVDMFPSR